MFVHVVVGVFEMFLFAFACVVMDVKMTTVVLFLVPFQLLCVSKCVNSELNITVVSFLPYEFKGYLVCLDCLSFSSNYI